ncbi:MAG TPA: GTP-binding protein [Candidatus Nanoarchaeia archaeon]|nr:GTP-binding protein [Candidatus Nanoarchaeia archaeon]
MTSLCILTGYLGAGKTTLLKRIIDNLDRKFAIIMNEFGDVNIDTQIIQGKNINIAELTGGCVCCSLTGEFEEAIKELKEKYNPELIIVETTGVAEPDALVVDVESLDVKLDSVVTIVDGDALVRFPQVGRTGAVQIEMGDIIILNKTDLIDAKQRIDVKNTIRKYNTKAPILETDHCIIDINLLFGIDAEHRVQRIKHQHMEFESFTVPFPRPVSRDRMETFLRSLPEQIYRIKGFLDVEEEGSHLLNYVAGRWELEPMEGQKNVVFIGINILGFKNKVISTIEKL